LASVGSAVAAGGASSVLELAGAGVSTAGVEVGMGGGAGLLPTK